MSPPSRPRYPMSPQRSARDDRTLPTPSLRNDGPDLLRRRVRHQPVDGHLDDRRHPRGDEPVGDPAPDLQGIGTHRRAGRARRRAAGHGVRRQRRPAGERQGRRRPVRLPAARRRIRGLCRVDEPPRLPPHRDAVRQRGPGRPARRRLDRVGGLWFPHRPPRTRRDRRCRPDAGGQPRTGRPALLSPRHRARGARRHHHCLLPAGVQRRVAHAAARALPGRHRGSHPRRRRARAQRRLRRPARRPPGGRHRLRRATLGMPGSCRSASTCRSC